MNRFILPLIGPYLKGATVLELGCNAGQLLLGCLRVGAAEAWGIEPDPRYRAQAMLVRQCLGLQRRMTILEHLPMGDALAYGRRADIGLMCAVLRHIPEGERVPVLEHMGRLCKRILIQSNGQADGPSGDNPDSVVKAIHEAGLRLLSIRCVDHVRGFVALVERR